VPIGQARSVTFLGNQNYMVNLNYVQRRSGKLEAVGQS